MLPAVAVYEFMQEKLSESPLQSYSTAKEYEERQVSHNATYIQLKYLSFLNSILRNTDILTENSLVLLVFANKLHYLDSDWDTATCFLLIYLSFV